MQEEQQSPWQEYMEKHKELVKLLRELKMPYDIRARLPLFKIFLKIDSYEDIEKINKAKNLIKDLTTQRRLGREPAHKYGRYV